MPFVLLRRQPGPGLTGMWVPIQIPRVDPSPGAVAGSSPGARSTDSVAGSGSARSESAAVPDGHDALAVEAEGASGYRCQLSAEPAAVPRDDVDAAGRLDERWISELLTWS